MAPCGLQHAAVKQFSSESASTRAVLVQVGLVEFADGQMAVGLTMLQAEEPRDEGASDRNNLSGSAAPAGTSALGAARAGQLVYVTHKHGDSGAPPLSLSELEFVAAEVNRHLERTRGHSVPASLENDLRTPLPGATGVSAGAVPAAADSGHSDCSAHADTESGEDDGHKPMDLVPGLANDAQPPAFEGGAPLARACSAVPAVPLAGTRPTVATGADSVVVALPRDLPVDPRLNFALAAAYVAFLLYLGAQAHTLVWSLVSSCAIAYLMLPTFFALRGADTLTVGGGQWEVRQHVLRGGGLFGGREARASMSRLVVKRGELADVVGAQVRHLLLLERVALCCARVWDCATTAALPIASTSCAMFPASQRRDVAAGDGRGGAQARAHVAAARRGHGGACACAYVGRARAPHLCQH